MVNGLRKECQLKMRVSVNIIRNNKHAESTCRALIEGIRSCGDEAVERADTDGDMADFDAAAFWGYWEPCQQIVKACRTANKPWVFFDLAYWGRDRYYKVTVNDRHPTAYFDKLQRPDDRFRRFNLAIKPWRHDGQHIIVAGMSSKAAWTWGLRAQDYETRVIAHLRALTARPIVYRPKPSWADARPIDGATFDKSSSIDKLLQNAWALVTHHSNAGCDALLQGVPVFSKYGVASGMGLRDLALIETPLYPEGREQWAANVAYCQWTLDELRNGTTWRHLQESGLIYESCSVRQ